MSELRWRRVEGWIGSSTLLFDLEAMRQILNECRPFLTKPIPEISWEEQQAWWMNLERTTRRYKAFVYFFDDQPDDRIAFSLLQWKPEGITTPLFGIRERARGHNIARKIIQHYLKEAEGPLHGEQLVSHAAICRMNEEAGWQITREENGVQYLYHPNEKQEYPDYRGLLDYWGVQ